MIFEPARYKCSRAHKHLKRAIEKTHCERGLTKVLVDSDGQGVCVRALVCVCVCNDYTHRRMRAMPVFWLGMQSGTIDKTTMHTSTYAISRPPHPTLRRRDTA